MCKTGMDYDVISSSFSMRGAGSLVGGLTGKSQPLYASTLVTVYIQGMPPETRRWSFAFLHYCMKITDVLEILKLTPSILCSFHVRSK